MTGTINVPVFVFCAITNFHCILETVKSIIIRLYRTTGVKREPIMPTLKFSVDSQLLKELGERLVGKPAIALAELIKNGYDADATKIEIEFRPEEDYIRVFDNGHGMTFEDFNNFWMRVGTTHKAEERLSPSGRLMTGSKGVGRLAVQLLAKQLKLNTAPQKKASNQHKWLIAEVDWHTASTAGELTSAEVDYAEFDDEFPFEHGTELILSSLNDSWTVDSLKELAREIWYLQPPFRNLSEQDKFEIIFKGGEDFKDEFQKQLDAIMEIQSARLIGQCKNGKVDLAIEFWNRRSPIKTLTYKYYISDLPHNKGDYHLGQNLNEARFDIRIYRLDVKQSAGIKVDDAKNYLKRYGGVHVYDGGFRLGYYGDKTNDWLGLEYEHSNRIVSSDLLPSSIQEKYKDTYRLNYLPTLRRVLGVVQVNTSTESNLSIAITRDRLIETKAFSDLTQAIRYAFHQYALDESLRQYEGKAGQIKTEPTTTALRRVEDVLSEYREKIPDNVYKDLYEGVQKVTIAVKHEEDKSYGNLALLGPLATAGVSAIAIQHELRKQFAWMERTIERLRATDSQNSTSRDSLNEIADDLEAWLKRARATNAIFDYMTGDTIEKRQRYKAKNVIDDVKRQLDFLARGIKVDITGIDENVYLPKASYAEWGAIFQNVLTNAYNAVQEQEHKYVRVDSRKSGLSYALIIQDTGKGVELKNSEKLFQPFQRDTEISSEKMAMGYGGTGLGLTIVRLLTENIGCYAKFTSPDLGFNTAFLLEWKETK